MAHAVRGLLLLPAYSGGFSAVCLICHFNAPVRRFNVWGYTYTAAATIAMCALFMALWRDVPHCSVACCLRGALPACRRSRSHVALSVAVPCSGGAVSGGLRWLLRRAWLSAKVSGKVAKVAGIVVRIRAKVAGKVAVKVAGACAKVAHLPQNHSRLQNSVYKGGIFLAHFPIVNGKSCKSRSVSAHFASKSLASMYFCWSCSGVKPSICGWFGVKTISCLSTMP